MFIVADLVSLRKRRHLIEIKFEQYKEPALSSDEEDDEDEEEEEAKRDMMF